MKPKQRTPPQVATAPHSGRLLRWALRGAAAIALMGVALVAGAIGAGWSLSAPGWQGPVTDHFDGTSFHNSVPTPLPDLTKGLRLLREGGGPPWEVRTYAPQPAPPERVTEGLRATFVNHATVLVQHDGLNLLTDPVWSERCSPFSFAGPARHHAPGVALHDLPPVDVVLISHNHYDHLDLPTLRTLAERDDPLLVVPLGVGATVAGLGFSRVVETDWGQSTTIGPLRVTTQEVRHFSSRGLFDRQTTLWAGFVVEGPTARWYFAGDTGYGAHFADTGREHGPFDLALLPIGAYGPRWFMGPIHMDPAQAVQAHADLRARASMGVHWGTFQLTREGQDAPAVELAAALKAAGVDAAQFRALSPGESMSLP